MTDVTLSFEVHVDAPVHAVFETCRDPRGIYAGDPTHEVIESTVAPDGLGTTARIRSHTGVFAEEIPIVYVEVVPGERIVFEAKPAMSLRGIGRISIPGAVHIWTWTFSPQDGGTRLAVTVVERDAPRWERVMDSLMRGMPTRVFSKEIEDRLGRIKARVEQQAGSTR